MEIARPFKPCRVLHCREPSVVDDIVGHYGVRRERLHAAGFGRTKPVAQNHTEAGKALNRRVELVRL